MPLPLLADLLLAAAAVAYAIASVLYFAQIAGKTTLRGRRWLICAALLHLGYFVLVSVVDKACPVTGIHTATSLMALSASAAFLVLARSERLEVVGAFVAPVALGALLAARFIGAGGHGTDVAPGVRSAVLPLHVTTILLASGLFAVASALAATYLLQERRLKDKSMLTTQSQLPPLKALDVASHRFLLAGFPLLTIGILTGLLWIGNAQAEKSSGALRQLLAFAAWIVFAVVLMMRAIFGWGGRRAAWGTIVGFGCALLVFFIYLARSGVAG